MSMEQSASMYPAFGSDYAPQSGPAVQAAAPQAATPYAGTMDAGTYKRNMHEMCKKYHHHFVQIETTEGKVFDGIVDGMDDDHVYLLIPIGDADRDDQRQFWGGFPHSPFGFGFGHPFFFGIPRRFRRFGRFGFPFFGLRRFGFPFFF